MSKCIAKELVLFTESTPDVQTYCGYKRDVTRTTYGQLTVVFHPSESDCRECVEAFWARWVMSTPR